MRLNLSKFGRFGSGGGGANDPLSGLTVTPVTIADGSPQHTVIATLAPVGGTAPYTYAITASNVDLYIVGDEVRANETINHADQSSVTYTIEVTDSALDTFSDDYSTSVTDTVVGSALDFNSAGTTNALTSSGIAFASDCWIALRGVVSDNASPSGTSSDCLLSTGAFTGASTLHVNVQQPSAGSNPSKWQVRLQDATHAQQIVSGAAIYGDGTAYVLIVQKSGTTISLFTIPIGGSETAHTPVNLAANLSDFTPAAARIGALGSNANSRKFDGRMDGVFYGTGVLTATQRANIAKGYHPKNDLHLTVTAGWLLNATSGTLTDESGGSNTATVNGTPTVVSGPDYPPHPTPLISLTTPAPTGEKMVYQANWNGSSFADADISPVGTYIGTAATIEQRVIRVDTAAVLVDWHTLDAAPASGAYDGDLNVGNLGLFFTYVETRIAGQPFRARSRQVGFGAVTLHIGQSNEERKLRACNVVETPNAYAALYTIDADAWVDLAAFTSDIGANAGANRPGEGAVIESDILATRLNRPVGEIFAAVGGSSLYDDWQTADAAYINAIAAALDATSGGLPPMFVSFDQGEADTADTYAARLAGLDKLRDDIASSFGVTAADIWFISHQLNFTGNSITQSVWRDVTRAQYDFAASDANVVFGGAKVDVPESLENSPSPSLHAADYTLPGARGALARLAALGVETTGADYPRITSFGVSGSTVTVNVTHGGGTSLSTLGGGASTDMWTATDDGWVGTINVTNAVPGANTITLTLASPPGTPANLRIRYAGSANVTRTNAIIDNSDFEGYGGLPLLPFVEDMAPT